MTSFNFGIVTKFEEIKNNYECYKMKCEKVLEDNILINTLIWNCQRLNLKLGRRDVKINFLKDVLNNNKVDIVYLIDVGNYIDSLFLNGYVKYEDSRNVLFVLNEIKEKFLVDKENMIIKSDNIKWAFTYLTPNTENLPQVKMIRDLIDKGYDIYGDFNFESNYKYLDTKIKFFNGEDTIRCGKIGKPPIKMLSMDGPSDHYALLYISNERVHHQYPLRIKEVNVKETIKDVKKILKGDMNINLRPKITIKQFKNKYTNADVMLNRMICDYVENNVQLAYRKYNYLWKYMKKEPFLGTYVNDNIIKTFGEHLKADPRKVYEEQIILDDDEISYFNLESRILMTKSHALTHEYHELSSVAKGVKEYIEREKEIRLKEGNNNMKDNNIINNVLRYCNEFKEHIRANTFFLMKNQKLNDFNDVRMILIIPSFIKIYELLIYEDVCNYVKSVINEAGVYQFGGIQGGSCYEAIYSIRNKYMELSSKALFVSDMSKGYDCVNLDILKKIFLEVPDRRVKYLLCNWLILIKNLDYIMNDKIVRRNRGIGMGLSLSPAIFVLYCHRCLDGIEKKYLIQYIDDLTIIFPGCWTPIKAKSFVNEVIEKFEKFDLTINKRKSKLISNDENFIKEFEEEFDVGNEDKFLGRELAINDSGYLVGDDRCFDNRTLTMASFPNYNIEGIKRLVINGAILAKLRYRFMCWSTSSKTIRHRIFSSNYVIFKGKNKNYSYVQLIMNMPNVFIFFLDAAEIEKFLIDYENNKVDNGLLITLLKSRLLTGIDVYDNAISVCEFNFKWWDKNNRLRNGILFMNHIFDKIKEKVIENYKSSREEDGVRVYPNIMQATDSKWYKNFRVFQNVIWCHNFMSKNKTIFIFIFFESIKKTMEVYAKELGEGKLDNNIDMHNFNFCEIMIPKDCKDDKIWSQYTNAYNQSLWSVIDSLITIENLSKNSKNNNVKGNMKKIFKLLCAAEMITNNSTFNDFTVEIMQYIFKIKIATMDPMLDNLWNVINVDIDNLVISDF